eukprot:s4938_g6.t1
MKAMKAPVGKSSAKKVKKRKKEKATAQVESPAKGKTQAIPAKGKSPAKGSAMKKPASAQTLASPNSEGFSLEEKMEAFHKKGNQNVNEFLDGLTQPQREALWGRFSRARGSLKDPAVDKMWNDHCKGKGSEAKKKQLLEVFLKSKGDLKKKNNIFHKEIMSICEVHGSLAWLNCLAFPLHAFLVPPLAQATGRVRNGCLSWQSCKDMGSKSQCAWFFGCIFVLFFSSALAASSTSATKVQRGSIKVRRDPRDTQEWQFSLQKEVAYRDKQQTHELKMETKNKVEAMEWMKANKFGSLLAGEDHLTGEEALSDVLPDKEKKKQKGLQLALQDKGPEDESENKNEDGDGDEESEGAGKRKSMLKAAADEADVLSDIGQGKNKEQTAKRVMKMVKLLRGLISQSTKKSQGSAATAHQKELNDCLKELQKLSKQGSKVNVEAAKNQLFEAALAVKRASKAAQSCCHLRVLRKGLAYMF